MACGWLTDKFGLCWQIVPQKIVEIPKRPKTMAAMMKMVKFDIATLEAAAKEYKPNDQQRTITQPDFARERHMFEPHFCKEFFVSSLADHPGR